MDQLRKFDIKPLKVEDINPGLLDDFSHFQKITKKYVKKNGEWEISDASILREWSTEKRIWITKYMCQQIERGGLTVGAFFCGKLIGFCCMDGIVSGNSAKYANLTMLFVDDNWKMCIRDSTTSIQKIENNRFSRADLESKLLMVDDDMDMSALPKTNYIKSIVTAECKMDLERKGVQSLSLIHI